MLCVCARHDPKGMLAINGNPLGVDAIARLAGIAESEAETLLAELDRNGVFSRNRAGCIYSRRMVRDEKISKIGRKHKKRGLAQAAEKKEKIPIPSRGPVSIPSPHIPYAIKKKEERKEESTLSAAAFSTTRDPPDGPNPPVPKPLGGGAETLPAIADTPPPTLTDLPDDAVALYDAVLAAAAVRQDPLPAYWMPPMAIIEVVRWRGLGLSDAEIVEIARISYAKGLDPPRGPKALERRMQIAASVKLNSANQLKTEEKKDGSASETLQRSIERSAEKRQGLDSW